MSAIIWLKYYLVNPLEVGIELTHQFGVSKNLMHIMHRKDMKLCMLQITQMKIPSKN